MNTRRRAGFIYISGGGWSVSSGSIVNVANLTATDTFNELNNGPVTATETLTGSETLV